jgi:osmotically inducible protein OsmC
MVDYVTEDDMQTRTEKAFLEKAEEAKKSSPVSKALAGTEIKLVAKFLA